MNQILRNKWLHLAVRLAIGIVFVHAGITKLPAPQEFADSIETFQLVPSILIPSVALALPIFEILCGSFLILGWRQCSSAFCIAVLTGIFAILLAQGIARGLPVDCGCFGSGTPSPTKTWISLGRDLLLFCGALLLYTLPKSANSRA